MKPASLLKRLVLFAAAAVLLLPASLTAPEKIKKNQTEKLLLAQKEVPEDLLLDIAIEVFDPGAEKSDTEQKIQKIYIKVREGESRYVPYHLKTTLERTLRSFPFSRTRQDGSVDNRNVGSGGSSSFFENSSTTCRLNETYQGS